MFSSLFLAVLVSVAAASSHVKPGPHHLSLAKRHAARTVVDRTAFSKRASKKRATQPLVRRAGSIVTSQPSGLASGTATADEGCTQWVQPSSGDSCYSVIALSSGLTLADFIDLNTSLDSECQNLQTNYYYCIDTDDSHDTTNALATGSCSTKSSKSSAKASSTQSSAKSTTTSNNSGISVGVSTLQLSAVVDKACGKNGATLASTDTAGPNGAIAFLNCGISKTDPSSGWTPPKISMSQVIYKNLTADGIFSACKSYISLFEKYGAAYDLPPIFLASFAMQESSCQPNASGDNGDAYGLMQITSDKCSGAPNGNCNDPEFNIKTGAAYFKSVLDSNSGDVLKSIGQYNGWVDGMSFSSATAAASGSCCVCQNDLDYLHRFLNGWALDDPNAASLTYYNNLGSC